MLLSEVRGVEPSCIGPKAETCKRVCESEEHHHHLVCDRCGLVMPFTDSGLEQLKGLTKLQVLLIPNSDVTAKGIEHLKGMTEMRELNLFCTQVDDSGLAHLKVMTKLERLDALLRRDPQRAKVEIEVTAHKSEESRRRIHTASEMVRASPQTAFAFLADGLALGRWALGCFETKALGDGLFVGHLTRNCGLRV